MGSWVQGGTYLKIENGDDPIFKYLTGNKFALIDISMIHIPQYRFTVPHEISALHCTTERNHFWKEIARGQYVYLMFSYS